MEIIKFLEKGPGFWILLSILLLALLGVTFFVKKSSKSMYTGRIVIPVLFIELAILFGVLAMAFPDKGDDVGPAVVPGLWIVSIIGLSVLLLVRALLGHEEKDPPWGRVSSVMIMIAMIVLYLFFMQLIGYFLATALFLISGMYYLSYRNWKVMISMSVGWILFSYFAFYKLLYVPLPQGILIERIFG